MNLRHLILVCAVSALATSCAHKVKKEEAKADEVAKVEEVKKEESGLVFACKVNKDIRLVNVERKEGRCEVFYTKYGEKEQVAWAEATPSLCKEIPEKIKSNIEGAGFRCEKDTALLIEKKEERTTASAE